MAARFWILVLSSTLLAAAPGCGSCRWHHRHCGLPYACVAPCCDDPACAVCCPVPPLYDGWCVNGGCGCGHAMGCGDTMVSGCCGTMAGCEMPCGQTMESGCGYPAAMDGCVIDGGCTSCPNCHHPLSQQTYSPPSAPAYSVPPSESLFGTPPASVPRNGEAVPMSPPGDPTDQLAPEPPPPATSASLMQPSSLIRPSEYFAPNKRSSGGPAPLSSTGPVYLESPPVTEASLQAPLEQTSMLRLPPLP